MAEESEDKSIELLSEVIDIRAALEVFGGSGGEFDAGAIGAMFGVINSFAVVATALVLTYLVAVSIIQTAHDGEPLGKRFSTLWVPVRTIGAFIMVVPFPGLGGFSVIQAMIFGLISLSVAGANMLFSETIDFFNENNGSLVSMNISSQPPPELAEMILRAQTCSHYVDNKIGAYDANAAFKSRDPSQAGVRLKSLREAAVPFKESLEVVMPHTYSLSWSGRDGFFDVGDANIMCGDISLSCSDAQQNPLGKVLCQARGEGMIALQKSLSKQAIPKKLQDDDVIPDRMAVMDASTAYVKKWNKVVKASNLVQEDGEGGWTYRPSEVEKQRLDDFSEKTKKEGWITAGQWYWAISAKSFELQRFADPELSIKTFNPDGIPDYEDSFTEEMTKLNRYMQVAMTPQGGSRPRPMIPSTEEADVGTDMFAKTMASSFGSGGDFGASMLLKGNDPIRSLSQYGHYLIAGSGTLLSVYIVSGAIIVGASNNTVGKATGIGAAVKWVANKLFTVLLAVAMGVITIGAFLAFYLPAIPFIFWMLAVLGWMIMVLESLIAAPLWAVAHAVPEGDGFAGRYALQGWQLMVNVVFRPILLTLGLLLSMFLMHAMAYFAVEGFLVTSETITATNGWSISAVFGWIFVNLILAVIIVILAQKSHEMIYETAENVMKWIGFGVTPLGAVGNEGKVGAAFKEGAQSIKGGAAAGIGKLGGGDKERDPAGGGKNSGGSDKEDPDASKDSPEKKPESGGGGKQAPK